MNYTKNTIRFLFLLCFTAPFTLLALTNDDDLNACWIQRLPVTEYVWGSDDPAVQGWPTNGQIVTWRAKVKNWLPVTVTNNYAFYLDGSNIMAGDIVLAPTNYTDIDCPWVWSFDKHELTFIIDPDNKLNEFSELNNKIRTWTDAITVGLWVEQSLYNYFHQYQKDLGIGANSWEDWAQRHVGRWNEMFENAVFGNDTPSGVLERIRLDQITVVPDGALPLSGGLPTNNPDFTNKTVDLQWGFPRTLLDGSMYTDHTSISDSKPFFFEDSLMHELGHARYLIDTYGFNVHDTLQNSNITILVDGKMILGTPYLPLRPPWYDSVYFPTKFGTVGYGLMASPKNIVDHYSAMALNLITKHRAWKGNYNSPQNIGVFKNDLPGENRFTVRDSFGNLLTNATVKIYQSGSGSGWYAKKYDNIPDMSLLTDANGQVFLGRCPFDTDGTIEHTYGKANGCPIMRVEQNGKTGFAFFNAMLFNMNYWRGITNMADYEIFVTMIGKEFDIAGINPRDGHVTPLHSIDQFEVVLSGTNNASSVKINGINSSYKFGKWRRSNVSLSSGSNNFTIIANWAGGISATQQITVIREDKTPPIVGYDCLLFPYPGAKLIAGEKVTVEWISQRITDMVDGNNCRISNASIVRADTRETINTIAVTERNDGSFYWTPNSTLPSSVPLMLSFTARDTSMNYITKLLDNNQFYIIPESCGVILFIFVFLSFFSQNKKTSVFAK